MDKRCIGRLFNTSQDLSARQVRMLLDRFYTVDTGRRLTQAELATLLGVADRRQVLRYRTEGMRAQTVPFLRLKGVVDGVFPVDALIENVEIAK